MLRWYSLVPLFQRRCSVVQTALARRALRYQVLALRQTAGALVGGLVGVGMALAGMGVCALVGQGLVTQAMGVWSSGRSSTGARASLSPGAISSISSASASMCWRRTSCTSSAARLTGCYWATFSAQRRWVTTASPSA